MRWQPPPVPQHRQPTILFAPDRQGGTNHWPGDLIAFVDKLIQNRNDIEITPENIGAVREALLYEVNETINMRLVQLLSNNDQFKLTALLDRDATNDEIEQFFQETIPNFQTEVATALLNFRAAYLHSSYITEGNMLKHFVFPLLVLVVLAFVKGVEAAGVVALALVIPVGMIALANHLAEQEKQRMLSGEEGSNGIPAGIVLVITLLFLIAAAIFLFRTYDWLVSAAFVGALIGYGVSGSMSSS